MANQCDLLRCTMIFALLSGTATKPASPSQAGGVGHTLQCIRDGMARSPAPWLDEWKREYIETIHSALEQHRDASHYAERLKILAQGFGPYWESFAKTGDRSLFEVHLARIRWYVEHLMETEFPTEQERRKLRDQYTDIWNYAVTSLLTQFPFLDPSAAQKAKADDLSLCYSKVDAPLLPIYLRPMSEQQVRQIKERWDKLRYARVDLWRTVAVASESASEKGPARVNPARDYELTKQSLSQLLGLVWMVVPQRPDYYIEALENRTKELKRRVEVKQQARSEQQRLEKDRSRQLLQMEHIGFLLAALLETALCPEQGPPVVREHQNPLERQDKSAKGGGAYEIDDRSEED